MDKTPRDFLIPIMDPGTLVGRYVIERLIGAEGMAVVYLAHDPDLDRRVALKLIRPDPTITAGALETLLTQEAKALARLSHPNVTAVYDVGSSPQGQGIFLTFEYVEGGDLRRFLRERRRRPREIIDLFVAAGEGLAAAHEAGLVHRDFKADNVLVGIDGAVKVTDFGLARLLEGGDEARATAPGVIPTVADRTARPWVPLHPAPEQLRPGEVDARADQFSFCAALFEALTGRPPFAGGRTEESSTAITASALGPLVSRLAIPMRARRAILRGLSLAPEQRFPSMRQLLGELAPRRRRPFTLAMTGAIATAALAALGYFVLGRPVAMCSGAQRDVDALLSPTRQNTIRQAFLGSGARKAEETWAAVSQRLGERITSWAAMRTDACEATRLRGEQSEAVLDLRMACLERRRIEIDALLSVFEKADAETVREAMAAAHVTGDPAACADIETLTAVAPLPADPALRARIGEIEKDLTRAEALANVGHNKEAQPRLTELAQASRELAYAPLIAQSSGLLAQVEADLGELAKAEESLVAAIGAATTAHAGDRLAELAVDMVRLLGADQARFTEARRWAALAEASIPREGRAALLLPRLHQVLGALLLQEGKVEESEQMMRKAVSLAQKLGAGTAAEGNALNGLGGCLSHQGKTEEARPLLERALALHLQHGGSEHPVTAATKVNLANALGDLGEHGQAVQLYREVLATFESAAGVESTDAATALLDLANAEQAGGQPQQAWAHASRALEVQEKLLGKEHPALFSVLNCLGSLLTDEGRFQEALAYHARAAAIVDAAYGPNHPARAEDLAGTGMALLGRGEYAKAMASLERALRLDEETGSNPIYIALEKSALGRALWHLGRDRARADQLVAEARDVLATRHQTCAVKKIDDWLQQRSGSGGPPR